MQHCDRVASHARQCDADVDLATRGHAQFDPLELASGTQDVFPSVAYRRTSSPLWRFLSPRHIDGQMEGPGAAKLNP